MMSKAVVASLVMILVPARAVPAGPCDPQCSTVPGAVTMSPDGSLEYRVIVACCATGPVSGAVVEIEFAAEVDELLTWAVGQAHPVLTATTDAAGEAVFHIAGSGCIDLGRFNPVAYIVQVRADGIVLAEPSTVNSPDAVDSVGYLPYRPNSLCMDGMTSTTLADAVFHTLPITHGSVEPCSRFTGEPTEPVTLEDAVVLTRFIKEGTSAACQP